MNSSILLLFLLLSLLSLSLSFFTNTLRSVGVNRSLYMQLEQLGRVTMYKKEGCPYCQKAKELLERKYELNINYVDIESEQREEILQQMRTFSGGRNTVPQIFFNADHLGGNDDVQKLEEQGSLASKVEYVRKNAVTMMQEHWYHPWY